MNDRGHTASYIREAFEIWEGTGGCILIYEIPHVVKEFDNQFLHTICMFEMVKIGTLFKQLCEECNIRFSMSFVSSYLY